MSERTEHILTAKLGEELYEKTQDAGMDKENLLHCYHALGQDKEKFQENTRQMLEETSEIKESLDQLEEQLKEELEQVRDIRQSIMMDQIIGED